MLYGRMHMYAPLFMSKGCLRKQNTYTSRLMNQSEAYINSPRTDNHAQYIFSRLHIHTTYSHCNLSVSYVFDKNAKNEQLSAALAMYVYEKKGIEHQIQVYN